MNVVLAFLLVAALALIAWVLSGAGLTVLFGVVIPYVAIAIFIGGVIWKVLSWAKRPVPFRIPSTCGQEKSLPWIKQAKLDNPSDSLGVLARMALEVFAFRSLFRNTSADLKENRIAFGPSIWLWAGAIVFHYSFLVVFLRHFRLFMEPVPWPVNLIRALDGFLELAVPTVYLSALGLLAGAGFLLLRRLAVARVRYISLLQDYVPLFLILGIALTGLMMQQLSFFRVNVHAVKVLVTGLFSFNPVLPDGVGPIFYVHLFLVCCLISYFPFSKLVHMAGVFMSPTRNLANNSRMKRHINPWNYPVKVHTYDEYEDEFRDLMKDAGMPLEKDA